MKKALALIAVVLVVAACGNSTTQSGGLPQLQATPANLAFGSIAIGQQSAPETLTVSNIGTFPAENLSLLSGGSGVTSYAVNSSTDCLNGVTIPPGGACTMIITFVPRTPAGDKPAFLDFVAQPDNVGVQVLIDGTAIAPP